MRREARLSILVSLLVLSGVAWGQSGGGERGVPRFTLAEQIIIERNDALAALLPIDPSGVRKILDALAVAKERPPVMAAPPRWTRRDAGAVVVDPLRNPDLEVFQRASPEAAYDLFQILKRVGGGQSVPK